MNETINDDRFGDMKSLRHQGDDDYNQMSLVNPLPADRPIGAQPVAVRRKTTAVLAEIKALAAAAGDAWYYRWPVNSKRADGSAEDGGKKWIEGPSIKLANDLARLYGNCDVDVRVVEDATSWVFYARFMDLETGFSMTRPFQQRKSQKSIRGDTDRQRDIAFQIGASKAIRNVVVNALQTYADYGFEEARNSLIEKIGKNIEGSRARLAELISERNIEPTRVERMIGRTVSTMLAPDIAKVLAMLKAIDDGMATIGETFPHETVVNPLANEPPALSQADVPPQPRQEPAGETTSEKAVQARRGRKPSQAAAPQAAEPAAPAAQEPQAEPIRDIEAQQEQEAREARGYTETQSHKDHADQGAGGIPGFLDRRQGPSLTHPATTLTPPAERTFFDEALDYIGAFQGSPGTLMDWYRGKRTERAALTMEQTTRVSQVYTAKFNALNAVDPL